MELKLDPSDLAKEFQRGEGPTLDLAISVRDVTFDKLNEKAQAAVRAVGRGVFYAFDGQTYNAVFSPDSSIKEEIEICQRPVNNDSWGARLGSDHRIWENGDTPYNVVLQLLRSLGSHGFSTAWDDYRVILLTPGNHF